APIRARLDPPADPVEESLALQIRTLAARLLEHHDELALVPHPVGIRGDVPQQGVLGVVGSGVPRLRPLLRRIRLRRLLNSLIVVVVPRHNRSLYQPVTNR